MANDILGVEDRDALYYPYIHIRSVSWLRSALLFFPHVLRMTPNDDELNDKPFVKELAGTNGRLDEPLVGRYPLYTPEALDAGVRLAERFRPDVQDPDFCKLYDRDAARRAFRNDSTFQIHRQKISDPLEAVLRPIELLWDPSQPNRGDWIAVHPTIGEIIMSTAAAAAAKHKGLDVLTDSERDHIVTATRDEDAIYATLLGRDELRTKARRPSAWTIGDLVIATNFDLSKLKARDFAALSREGDALFDFRALLAESAARIPAMTDHEMREKRAKEAAENILHKWEEKRRTFGRFLKRVFRLEAAGEAKSAAKDLLKASFFPAAGAGLGATKAAAAGTASGALTGGVVLGVVPGLAVGLTYYGVKTWRDLGVEEDGAPTRFLSRIVKRGGLLSAPASGATEN